MLKAATSKNINEISIQSCINEIKGAKNESGTHKGDTNELPSSQEEAESASQGNHNQQKPVELTNEIKQLLEEAEPKNDKILSQNSETRNQHSQGQ